MICFFLFFSLSVIAQQKDTHFHMAQPESVQISKEMIQINEQRLREIASEKDEREEEKAKGEVDFWYLKNQKEN